MSDPKVSAAELLTTASTLATTAEALAEAVKNHPVLQNAASAPDDLAPVKAAMERINAALLSVHRSLTGQPEPDDNQAPQPEAQA